MLTDPVRCWLFVRAREAGGRRVELRLPTFQPGRHLQQVCLPVLLRPPILLPRDEASIPPHAPHRGAVAGLCMQLCVCVRARALAHPGRWRERVNACLHARTRVLNGGRACMFVLTSSVSTLCLCTCPFTHARRSATRTHREKDLDTVGFQVGQKLAERYSKDKGVFENDLAVITFLCKDFWTEVYGKQMDKLRTNHKGVFELQDHRFRSVLRISTVHNTRARTLVPPDRYAGHARHVTPVYAFLPTHPHQAAHTRTLTPIRSTFWAADRHQPAAPAVICACAGPRGKRGRSSQEVSGGAVCNDTRYTRPACSRPSVHLPFCAPEGLCMQPPPLRVHDLV